MAALSVHHVGVAVDDLERGVRTWVELFAGVEPESRSSDAVGVIQVLGGD